LQDVLTEIGAPESYYFKQEQLVQLNDDISAWKDCFLNYFSLGIDIVIARETNTVKKFVFHTNFPSSHDFYRYNKANFELRPANSNSDHVINANTTVSYISFFLFSIFYFLFSVFDFQYFIVENCETNMW